MSKEITIQEMLKGMPNIFIVKVDNREKSSKLKYLLAKEKVAGLDKTERYELQELLNAEGGK